MNVPTGRLGVVVIFTLVGVATVAALAAAVLNGDPRANTATAVALLAGSIAAAAAAVSVYRYQPKTEVTPAKSWREQGREARRQLATVAAIVALIWIGGYASVWLLPTSVWAYKWRYAFEDHLDGATVQVDPKPHDCEFLTAPIGSKHCDYESVVTTVRISVGQSGERLISYDDGRTWQQGSSSARPAVFVTWRKVDD